MKEEIKYERHQKKYIYICISVVHTYNVNDFSKKNISKCYSFYPLLVISKSYFPFVSGSFWFFLFIFNFIFIFFYGIIDLLFALFVHFALLFLSLFPIWILCNLIIFVSYLYLSVCLTGFLNSKISCTFF